MQKVGRVSKIGAGLCSEKLFQQLHVQTCTSDVIFIVCNLSPLYIIVCLFVCCVLFSPVGDPCLIEAPCLNGGTCNNTAVGEFECVCTYEWLGTVCERGKYVMIDFAVVLLFDLDIIIYNALKFV